MKITCPKCNATGSIPDHEVPESGRFISCPRCNEGFTVTKVRAVHDAYLVDTCPSCSFSTFGDETFSTCPKCGIAVKTFVERQREEQMLKHNQELLGKKFNNVDVAPPPAEPAVSVADFIDNLHPVNLISWGVAAVAVIVLGLGLWGVIGYDSVAIKALLMEESGEPVSGLFVFLHYGLLHWLKVLYGLAAMAVSLLLIKRLKSALHALSGLLWVTIALVPLSYIITFIYWVVAPIPHTIGGYLIEILNIIFMSALVAAPLYLLEQYLHERKITSVFKL
ncbi:MAG: zinc-ribbon domain-containing protein [Desulfuromonadaceae bacterium]|nr:zinc-ribbon domain-containing protein [Desulfuromonadaceae bacterium]MDD2848376.1 zinc-ribbon domain-containing protein [Desulfuromonadaceae bacterium]MDD4129228.1 zinc-ribbon domain-containing protein [Desulfuromonadaceae bacterium]